MVVQMVVKRAELMGKIMVERKVVLMAATRVGE